MEEYQDQRENAVILYRRDWTFMNRFVLLGIFAFGGVSSACVLARDGSQ